MKDIIEELVEAYRCTQIGIKDIPYSTSILYDWFSSCVVHYSMELSTYNNSHME
jgi:hypothetical protein